METLRIACSPAGTWPLSSSPVSLRFRISKIPAVRVTAPSRLTSKVRIVPPRW